MLDLYTWKNGTAKQSPAEFRSYYEALDRGNQNVVWPDHAKEPLYGYRNTPFFPEFGAFLPLQDAHSAYQEAREHDFWPANFWPMFHDDAILMDIDPASATFGQVHLWSPSLLILEPELYYDSLETMFTTYIAALDANFIPFGDELEPNFSNYGALAAQLNPLSAPTSWRS